MPTTIYGSIPEYLAACAVVAVAQAVYVLFGFGSGLIAVGSLALVFPNIQDVVVMLLVINLPAEMFVVLRSRESISWSGVLVLFVGVCVGIPVGTSLLRLGDPGLILVLLGAFLVVVGTVFAGWRDPDGIRWPGWVAPSTGVVSGVLTGLFGTGGPPLIVYYRLAGLSKAAFRGNLMAIFLLMTLVRVPSYAIGGLITASRVWSGIALIPAVAVGAWAGNRLHVEVPERTFRRLVGAVLVVIGAVLLLRWFRGAN